MAQLDPRSPEFWQQEAILLGEAVASLIMRAYMAGAAGGADLLPAGAQQLINWDVFNRAALDFLRRYRLDTVQNITETTRKTIIGHIDDWIQSGEHLDVLKARLAEMPVLSKTRADMIAITEVTRIFSVGKKEAWKSTGIVTAQVWITQNDELVCPICGPLHGKAVSIDADFPFDANVIATSPQMRALLGDSFTPGAAARRAASMVNNLGAGVSEPPAHPRCKCDLSPRISTAAIDSAFDDIFS